MDDDCCELLRCCCECGLCLGLCCLCCKDSGSRQPQAHPYSNKMDIVGPICVVVICVIIFSLCGWCCKRKRDGTVYRSANGASVTVTTTQPVPQPYPVHGGPPPGGYAGAGHYGAGPAMPILQPQPGFYPPPMGYPPHSAPYPPPHAGPYPPAPGPVGAPYPPTGYHPQPGFQNQPPPYDVAMSMGPGSPPPPQTEVYGKQAPYNPHYQS